MGTLSNQSIFCVIDEGFDKSGCTYDGDILNDANVENVQRRQRNRLTAKDGSPSTKEKSTPRKVPQQRRQKVRCKLSESDSDRTELN